jgi:hypothetical protein
MAPDDPDTALGQSAPEYRRKRKNRPNPTPSRRPRAAGWDPTDPPELISTVATRHTASPR